MGRRSTQAEPSVPPGDVEFRWGAEVFSERAGFMPYGPRIAMYVYSVDAELMEKLQRTFGGRIARVSSTNRWMLYAELLVRFLEGIRPFLKGEEDPKRVALAEEVLAVERTRVRSVQDESILLTATALAEAPGRRATDSALLLPEVDESEVEIRGTVPAGPWAVDDPIIRAAQDSPEGMHLLALSLQSAESFALIARSAGLLADIVRVKDKAVVRLVQNPDEPIASRKVLLHRTKEKN
jgi:hypothetical protein